MVPDRLAYPEIYPAHARYRGFDQLVARLRSLVADRPAPGTARRLAETYTFETLQAAYQQLVERLAGA